MDNAVLVPEIVVKGTWKRARELVASVHKGLLDSIELGLEIKALREQFFAQGDGGGGDHKSAARITYSARGVSDQEKGWNAQVEKELGISFQAAYRLMERAEYLMKLKALAEGQTVKYLVSPGVGKKLELTLESTPERAEIAKLAIEHVLSGEANAHRAFVGVVGESRRREKSGKERRDPDYRKLVPQALSTLRNAFERWGDIEFHDRNAILIAVETITALMPPEIRSATARTIACKWPDRERAELSQFIVRELKHGKVVR